MEPLPQEPEAAYKHEIDSPMNTCSTTGSLITVLYIIPQFSGFHIPPRNRNRRYFTPCALFTWLHPD